MFERIIKIITFMISQMEENPSFMDIDVEELQALGYTQSEISTAFSWLVDKVDISREKELSNPALASSESFRMLHDGEKGLFTPRAWGRIVSLQSMRLLDNSDIEKIIEKAIVGGDYKMSDERLDRLLSNILAEGWSKDTKHFRTGLSGNDTVH